MARNFSIYIITWQINCDIDSMKFKVVSPDITIAIDDDPCDIDIDDLLCSQRFKFSSSSNRNIGQS